MEEEKGEKERKEISGGGRIVTTTEVTLTFIRVKPGSREPNVLLT